MKLLRLFKDEKYTQGQFYDFSQGPAGTPEDKFYKAIDLIEADNIKDLLMYIIKNDDAEFDEFDEESLQNPAQRLIYKELHDELVKVNNSRKSEIEKIDKEFEGIENKYKNN